MSRLSHLAAAVGVFALVGAACGGGTAEVDGTPAGDVTPGFVVETENGLATLTLGEGSLPQGTSLDDIRLDAVVSPDAVDGIPIVRVQLLPHGLILSEPAALTIRLPETLVGGFIAIHKSEMYGEFLGGDVTLDSEGLQFTTTIEHFSSVDVYDGLFIDSQIVGGSMVLTPNPVSVDQAQEAYATLPTDDTVSLLFDSRGPDDELSVTLYEFGLTVLDVSDTEVSWSSEPDDSAWSPRVATSPTNKTPSGWEVTASSTCLEANAQVVESLTRVRVRLTLVSVGSSTDVDLVQFAEAFTGHRSTVSSIETYQGGRLNTVSWGEEDIGGNFDVDSYSHASSETICTDDTAQASSGMDPRAHVVSVDPVVTADGTQGLIVVFAQPWTGLPDLFSFFVELDITAAACSMTAGVETHAGTVDAPGPWRLLDDGSVFVDTGCDIDPGAPIDIVGRSGSWDDELTTQPVFADIEFRIDPDAVANAPGPFDAGRVVDNLGADPTPSDLNGFQIVGASNDGSGKMTVDFKGPVKDLAEGDEHIVDFRVEASEGGIRAFATLRNIDGELIPNGATFDDADQVGGTIGGKRVDAMWEWMADDQIVVTMVSTEGVPIPSTVPTVMVTVKVAGSTDEYTFTR